MLRLYYKLKAYKLQFDTDADGKVDITQYVKYGAPIVRQITAVTKSLQMVNDSGSNSATVQRPTSDKGVFNCWEIGGKVDTLPATMDAKDVLITAVYVKPEEMGLSMYHVRHYLAIAGTYTFELFEPETFFAVAGTTVTAIPNKYVGYAPPTGDLTGIVKADGSLYIDLYYGEAEYELVITKQAGVTDAKATDDKTRFARGASVTVTAVMDDNHVFDGWSCTSGNLDGSKVNPYPFTMPAGKVELTAKARGREYTVAYDPNGGTITGIAQMVYTYGVEQNLPKVEHPTLGFMGWQLVGGTGEYVTTIAPTTSGDVKYVAAWSTRINMTFDANGGTINGQGTLVLSGGAGGKINAPATPVKPGYTFGGWEGFNGTVPNEDRTYVAKWTTGGSGGGAGEGGGGPVTGVTFGSLTGQVQVGGTKRLVATIEPANADNPKLIWSSGDLSIATVDENGNVTGIAEGTVIITVTTEDGGFTATCTITVTLEAPVEPVDPGDPDVIDTVFDVLDVQVKTTADLPTFKYAKVKWGVEDTSIAKLTGKGKKIKGLAVGETTLYMEVVETIVPKSIQMQGHYLEAGKVYRIELHVIKKKQVPTKIAVEKAKITLDTIADTTAQIVAKVKPAGSILDDDVYYETKNPAIATVDRDGLVTAVAPGKTTVYVYAANLKRVSVTVNVKGLVTSIKILKKSGAAITKLSKQVGTEYPLGVKVNDAALNKVIKWSSSNKKVATVDENGVVTMLKKGTATITAKATDGSGKKATLKLTVKN